MEFGNQKTGKMIDFKSKYFFHMMIRLIPKTLDDGIKFTW